MPLAGSRLLQRAFLRQQYNHNSHLLLPRFIMSSTKRGASQSPPKESVAVKKGKGGESLQGTRAHTID